MSLAIGVIALALSALPGRTAIPPLVESDYCYLLTAADRYGNGDGLTSTPPVAPFQPWMWHADWTALTKWPVGYPLLVVAVRNATGLGTIEACRVISVVACAAALVGWFVWIRRWVSRGVAGCLLSAVGAGCGVTTSFLVNPSTDLLIVAALPWVLLLVTDTVHRSRGAESNVAVADIGWRLALVGAAAGSLFWIRYASVFVPVALGLHLCLEMLRKRGVRCRHLLLYTVGAMVPILSLLIMNRAGATSSSWQEQLNLGQTVTLNLSPALVGTAWWNLTDLGFYDYHWISHWMIALWPIVLAGAVLVFPSVRGAIRSFFLQPGIHLSAMVVAVLLVMLVGATAVFGDKYPYASLDRYYAPARPLFMLVFVGPLLLARRRMARGVVCVILVVASSWLVQQEWARPYHRWSAAGRELTPYGQWGQAFSPGAGELYRWLSDQSADHLVVVSNFHDYIALETGIPAIPIPEDPATLALWVRRISEARSVAAPRVLFVLDPDNRTRDYFLEPTSEVVRRFGLAMRVDRPSGVSALLFEWDGANSAVASGRH